MTMVDMESHRLDLIGRLQWSHTYNEQQILHQTISLVHNQSPTIPPYTIRLRFLSIVLHLLTIALNITGLQAICMSDALDLNITHRINTSTSNKPISECTHNQFHSEL
eukprot:169365_1